MKEAYYTDETIHQRAQEFMAQVQQLRDRREPSLSSEKSALLILDMQDYFLNQLSHAYVPSASAILPVLNTLIEAYRLHGSPIIFTRHLDHVPDSPMRRWWIKAIEAEDPMSEIAPGLDISDELVIEKAHYDAFRQTKLHERLKDKGIEQVVIGGVMTHLCCETTARTAFMLGYEVFFLVDGTATYNANFHLASIQNLAHGFAYPILAGEVIDRLEVSGED